MSGLAAIIEPWHGKASSQLSGRALQRATLEGWLSTQTSPNTRAAYRCDLEAFGNWCARQRRDPVHGRHRHAGRLPGRPRSGWRQRRRRCGDDGRHCRRSTTSPSQRDLRPINPALGVDRPKVRSGDPSPTVQLSEEAVASCRAWPPRSIRASKRWSRCSCSTDSRSPKRSPSTSMTSPATAEQRRSPFAARHDPKRIVLHPDSARGVRRCIGKRRSGPVFVNERSSKTNTPHRLTRFGADHLIRQLRTDDTTEQVTANALRRFHITARQADGNELDDVRDRAGLANVRSVRRYDPTSDQRIDHRSRRQGPKPTRACNGNGEENMMATSATRLQGGFGVTRHLATPTCPFRSAASHQSVPLRPGERYRCPRQ